ncbi:MAG TPA: hypothetical protein VGF67_18745 [Ktedonobacteraceae bacterium]|jgi:hypothetical protein
MSKSGNGPVPDEQVLAGISAYPPSLAGDLLFGTLVAWADPDGQIFLASSQDSPAYQPRVVNPAWKTLPTPAVALALDWGRVYLAWTAADGIHLANSGDGWNADQLIPAPVNVEAGPALAFSGDTLYIAWRASNSLLGIATCDFTGTIQWRWTERPIFSAPSLTWSDGKLYALAGGSQSGAEDPTIRIYLSTDGGASFDDVATQQNTSVGAPALAIARDMYYLVWADGQTSRFNAAATTTLSSYTTTSYTSGCHNGAPALLLLPETLCAGWSYGASQDPRAHHITLGQVPISGQPMDDEEIRRYVERVPTAPEPCPDPLTIYNPAEQKCVLRGGCMGGCVLRAFSSILNMYLVFNPILYAICVINCETRGSEQEIP